MWQRPPQPGRPCSAGGLSGQRSPAVWGTLLGVQGGRGGLGMLPRVGDTASSGGGTAAKVRVGRWWEGDTYFLLAASISDVQKTLSNHRISRRLWNNLPEKVQGPKNCR